ncbi:unnamed protein product [Aphanomyces euteiches]|uniref:DUF1279 domain-containing protein n=1 Tax=Aphanomyces euteiches TaxID=100861 RepID=A0A6G0W5Y3_9STRA|nr:hypothetical protein Ae201684_018371 [Aphanomyces euteiches]KAH9140003.1 hypothetical protein AeRB84_015728 [Aphanomyces euteiches]
MRHTFNYHLNLALMWRRVVRNSGRAVGRVQDAQRVYTRIFCSATRPALSSFQPPPSSFSPEDPNPTMLKDAVNHFNAALKDHTAITFGVMITSDMTAVFGTYALLQAAGVTISPEFALAFAASRPLRRLRMPLDIAAAAFLSKYFPELTQVKVSSLMPALPPTDNANPSLIQRGLSGMSSIMDKYGACYMIGSRLMGLTVVSSIYVALLQGVDILPLLNQYGLGDVGSAMGTWAAAVTLSSVFYPVTLGLTGYIVPRVARIAGKAK